jgi:hypothetical protein
MAWTTAVATGVACAVTAASAAWLLLTQPLAVTASLDGHDLGALFQALMVAVLDAAAAVLRLF